MHGELRRRQHPREVGKPTVPSEQWRQGLQNLVDVFDDGTIPRAAITSMTAGAPVTVPLLIMVPLFRGASSPGSARVGDGATAQSRAATRPAITKPVTPSTAVRPAVYRLVCRAL